MAGRTFASILAAGCVAAALPLACSGGRPRELGDEGAGSSDASAEPAPFSLGDGATKPPMCGELPDGAVCACVDLALLTDVPNVYFVLDRSGSMVESDKWGTVRTVVATTVQKLGPRIAVGAAVFPARPQDSCTPGAEVMSVRAGDPISGVLGPTTNELLEALNIPANGGTPTSATLQGLLPALQSLRARARTYVVLATDGGPNCANISCSIDQCIPNIEGSSDCVPNTPPNCCDQGNPVFGPLECLDSANSVAAVKAYADAGIAVFVIGVPGSGPYAALLDQMATAGGTAREGEPKYYAVGTTDQGAFADALAQIAAKITATCTFDLKTPPDDPGLVNVYLDEVVVPKDPVNGWDIQGSTVTLLGTTCQRVLSGEVLDVRVIAGCPTKVL